MEFPGPLADDWEPISRATTIAWTLFYVLFLVYAASNSGRFLMADYVFLPTYEGGRLLFGWFGQTIGVMGGTLFQLLVLFAIAACFITRRQILGTALTVSFFFEDFLNIATYMPNARRQELPLVTAGNADYVEHDWAFMFGKLGVLQYDTSIATAVRVLGWLGMIGVAIWLCRRSAAAAKQDRVFAAGADACKINFIWRVSLC